MQRKEYSAGAVKLSFWFSEFRKVVLLLQGGKSMSDIRLLAETENIFSAVSELRRKQIFLTVSMRVSVLSDRYYYIMESSSIETQKLVVLISIMNTDTLFFDFMHDVFREKLITGDTILADMDIRVFFRNKQRESEKVAAWKDETLKRLQKSYKSWLSEAGLLDHSVGDRKIIRPLIDCELEALLIKTEMQPILNALKGTR